MATAGELPASYCAEVWELNKNGHSSKNDGSWIPPSSGEYSGNQKIPFSEPDQPTRLGPCRHGFLCYLYIAYNSLERIGQNQSKLFVYQKIGSVAVCSPAESLTFSG